MKNREFELKFEIRPQHTDRLLAHPLLERRGDSRHLISTYYDTDGLALWSRGLTLRVRRSDEPFTTQTLKRSSGSIVERDEWERDSLSHLPDHKWLRRTPAARDFKKKRFPKGLEAQFTVDVERAVVPISHKRTIIEGALDRGLIRAGGVSAPVSEFELELKAGRKSSVRRVARKLVRDVPLVLSLSSKSRRGYSVADLTHGQPTSALGLRLARKATLAEAFETTVQSCLNLMLTNTWLIGADREREAIHDARIALRRLRAALDLFRPCLRKRYARAVRRDVKWIARRLGAVRDPDVLLEALAEDAIGGHRSHVIDGLRERRRARHADLRRVLASPRWRLMLLSLLTLSMKGVRCRMRDKRFRTWARKRLVEHQAPLSKKMKRLSGLSADARHDLRKTAKAFRYNLDVFARIEGNGRDKRLTVLRRHLHDFQDELGAIRDGEILRSYLRENDPHGRATENATEDGDLTGAIEAARRIRRTALS